MKKNMGSVLALYMELNEITIWGARYNEQQERLTEK